MNVFDCLDILSILFQKAHQRRLGIRIETKNCLTQRTGDLEQTDYTTRRRFEAPNGIIIFYVRLIAINFRSQIF